MKWGKFGSFKGLDGNELALKVEAKGMCQKWVQRRSSAHLSSVGLEPHERVVKEGDLGAE
jgi:hypothetical protein